MIRIRAGLKEVGHEPEDNNLKKEMSVMVAILIVVDNLGELRQVLETVFCELVDAEDSRQARSADLFDRLCNSCECPIRVRNALTRLSITTIEGLYHIGPSDFLQVRGVGPAVLNDLTKALRVYTTRYALDADKLAHWFV